MVIGALALTSGLLVAAASAKCPKACKQEFVQTHKSCVQSCKLLSDKAAKKACKKSCATDLKTSKSTCKHATSPTPPGCSPSGAFLE
jgi:hypothetical protein